MPALNVGGHTEANQQIGAASVAERSAMHPTALYFGRSPT